MSEIAVHAFSCQMLFLFLPSLLCLLFRLPVSQTESYNQHFRTEPKQNICLSKDNVNNDLGK